MANETLITVPNNIEQQEGALRKFLMTLVEKLDVVLGYRGNSSYVSTEDIAGLDLSGERLATAEDDIEALKASNADLVARITNLVAVPETLPKHARPKVAGAIGSSALGTLLLTVNRVYFIPVSFSRSTYLSSLGVSVTTGVAGTATIGIYDSVLDGSADRPNQKLAEVTGLSLAAIAEVTAASEYTLSQGTLYWLAIVGSSAATIRAATEAAMKANFGLLAASASMITHTYFDGPGGLPATISSVSNQTGNAPAILMFGA
jgi:hypothetical protein